MYTYNIMIELDLIQESEALIFRCHVFSFKDKNKSTRNPIKMIEQCPLKRSFAKTPKKMVESLKSSYETRT